jgi:hypothetical protein
VLHGEAYNHDMVNGFHFVLDNLKGNGISSPPGDNQQAWSDQARNIKPSSPSVDVSSRRLNTNKAILGE